LPVQRARNQERESKGPGLSLPPTEAKEEASELAAELGPRHSQNGKNSLRKSKSGQAARPTCEKKWENRKFHDPCRLTQKIAGKGKNNNKRGRERGVVGKDRARRNWGEIHGGSLWLEGARKVDLENFEKSLGKCAISEHSPAARQFQKGA